MIGNTHYLTLKKFVSILDYLNLSAEKMLNHITTFQIKER